jgi:hypothetical protein
MVTWTYHYGTYLMGILQILTLKSPDEFLTVQERKELSFLKSPHCNSSIKTVLWGNSHNKMKANALQSVYKSSSGRIITMT